MKITAGNMYGGKNNDHMNIELVDRKDFSVMDTILDALIKESKDKNYGEGSHYDLTVKLAKELSKMMHPMNTSPKRYLEIKI